MVHLNIKDKNDVCKKALPTFPSTKEAFKALVNGSGFTDIENQEDRLEWSCELKSQLLLKFDNAASFFVIQASPNPLVSAAHLAFDKHYGLILKPDVIWLALAQGFAAHLRQNPQKYGALLGVKPGQKSEISIRRDDFVKGSPSNRWDQTVDEFSAQILKAVGPQPHALVVNKFSTTTVEERIASEVVLMDIMSPFFDFDVTTMCGIPFIELEGTVDDWKTIRKRVEQFEKYDLGWWVNSLKPVLDEFVNAFTTPADKINKDFWSSILKVLDQSGGPYVTGWINVFFPYISIVGEGDGHGGQEMPDEEIDMDAYMREISTPPNEPVYGKPKGRDTPDVVAKAVSKLQVTAETTEEDFFEDEVLHPRARNIVNDSARNWKDRKEGPTTGCYPSGLSRVPFTWTFPSKTHDMEFLAGFVGLSQDSKSFAVRPEVGYAVVEKPQKK